MIGRRRQPIDPGQPEPKGYDDYDVRLGDIMRGERATIGKSLLDVQRELKIKATYIAAIENADIAAFETPGFIAGYVRSYARYLNLDPDWCYATFCQESGFAGGTTLDRGAATGPVRRAAGGIAASEPERDPIAQPRISFAPESESPFASIDLRAVASTMVLVGLIGAIGYGGWSILQEVQRVQVAPVDQAPDAVAQVDPLEGASFAEADMAPDFSGIGPATREAFDRLYRPEALDVPVMVARDGPIAALDPQRVGALATGNQAGPGPDVVSSGALATAAVPSLAPQSLAGAALPNGDTAPLGPNSTPRVTAEGMPEVMLVAVGEVWLRVRAADGSTLNERTMRPGDTYVVPPTEEPPTLRVGSAGAVYFTVNGVTHGPAGSNGQVLDQIALGAESLTQTFARVDPTAGGKGAEAVQVAEAALGLAPAAPETAPAQ